MTVQHRLVVVATVVATAGMTGTASWRGPRAESHNAFSEGAATVRSPAPDVVAPDRPSTQPSSPDVEAGAKLFVAYNCGDCHGAGGSGAMGPSLQDNRWRFGGTSAEIARSITDGRPEGMPAWGPRIPAAHVRQLVAYIESLGVGKDVTTENFAGATVERSGH